MILLDIPNGLKTAIMVVAMIAVFYFFLIRPQSKKTKDEAKYRDSLAKGDRVMTNGGIHGTIVSTDANHVMLEVAKDVRIKVGKTAITPLVETKA